MIRRFALIPLSMALLYFPSLRYTLALDGAVSEYRGLPLPWNSSSLATSLAKEIYLLPLAIDLIFIAILGRVVLSALGRLAPSIFKSSLLLIWLAGALGLAMMLISLAFDSTFHLWPNPGPFFITAADLSSSL